MAAAPSTPMKRIAKIVSQLQPVDSKAQSEVASTDAKGVQDTLQKYSPETLRWNGWGFKDTAFELNARGQVELKGSRYLFSGKELPDLRKWMEDKVGLDINNKTPAQAKIDVPKPVLNDEFVKALEAKKAFHKISSTDSDRMFHAHGHTCQELFELRYGKVPRVPDLVVWPGCHDHVQFIVSLAAEHNVVIIPFGGGTSVTYAVRCPEEEKRMIISLDMHAMNNIKWINRDNMMACIEAGAVGKDIEAKLSLQGLTFGHEPDSHEFSTLGGWIATRASGMRKNRYGNIEDLIISIKCVTPTGTIEKSTRVPRTSNGPDIHHFILGSEGIFGIVTEAIVKLRPVSASIKYGSMIFPNFESGVRCLHEIALNRHAPVSIRLVDNMQFQFGQALKPGAGHDWRKRLEEKAKKWYVTKALKFDVNKMCAATLLFEGTPAEIAVQEKNVYSTAAKYGGMAAGEDNGIRGYFLTYMIAYLRDFGFNFSFMSESFETSVPFDKIMPLCESVTQRIRDCAKQHGVRGNPLVSARVTQLYDTGAAVYFYFGFMWTGLKDPVAVFSDVEHQAREEILKHGGCLSHHHGVGKLRKSFFPGTQTETALQALKAVKQQLDPKNILAAGNLFSL